MKISVLFKVKKLGGSNYENVQGVTGISSTVICVMQENLGNWQW